MAAIATTPLLLLLDSVLSQDATRIQEARTRIRQLVDNAPMTNQFDLLQEVDMLLNAFPNLASVASTHDGSSPLHFAASIGDVSVARRILIQVS